MTKISEETVCILISLIFLSITVFGQDNSNDTRTGHTAIVNSIAFSPDSKFLASASEDETIIVWDVVETVEVLKIHWNDTTIQTVAYSPDGKIIAGGGLGSVKFWDAKSGKEIGMLKNNEYEVINSISFSFDGTQIAMGSDESVSIWNVATRRKVRDLEKSKSPVAFHPKGILLATAGGDDLIKIWNVKTGIKMRTIEGAGDVITLRFNPFGNVLAGVNNDDILDKKVKLWQTINGVAIKTPQEIITTGLLAFTLDGKNILVGNQSYDEIQILNAVNGKEKETFGGKIGFAVNGIFSPNGKYFAVLSDSSKDVNIFDFQTKEEYAKLAGHTISVDSLAFTSNDKLLLAAYDDGTLINWNISNGKLEEIVVPEKPEVEDWTFTPTLGAGILISPNAQVFAITTYGGTRVFNTSDGYLLSSEKIPGGNIIFSPNSEMLAVAESNSVALLESPNGSLIYRFALQFSDNSLGLNLAFSSDSKIIAVGSKDKILLWDIESRKEIKTIESNFQTNPKLFFSHDDKSLIVADEVAQVVKVIDISTESVSRIFEAQGSNFTGSKNGKILAASNSESIILSDLVSGKAIRKIKIDSAVTEMRFSEDGSILAIGSNHGVILYKTTTGEKNRSMN